MLLKIWGWIKTIGEAWKIFLGITLAVSTIGTAAIKINKGISALNGISSDVRYLIKSDSIKAVRIEEISQKVGSSSAKINILDKNYTDYLKLINRMDLVVKYYEEKDAAGVMKSMEAKPTTPVPIPDSLKFDTNVKKLPPNSKPGNIK